VSALYSADENKISNLTADKKLFDPSTETVNFNYNISQDNTEINVSVYNETGYLIKRIRPSLTVSGNPLKNTGFASEIWDGKDDNNYTDSRNI
jgi:hypothetical protein